MDDHERERLRAVMGSLQNALVEFEKLEPLAMLVDQIACVAIRSLDGLAFESCFIDGFSAGIQGHSKTTTPYLEDTKEHTDWLCGHEIGIDLRWK